MFMLGLATCHSRYARLAFPPQLTRITSQTLPELRWFWSITVYVDPKRGIVTTGRASTIEAAKAQFLANWEKCGGDSSPGRPSVCPRRAGPASANISRRHAGPNLQFRPRGK
jgi:hypothetical protein